mmetsp:Transcript_30427/g.97062  ORF Transcript_30427/g.97062 Transcript_30427/m.97062 type:complete len:333 (-) Transcript_30427:117-1115(-)
MRVEGDEMSLQLLEVYFREFPEEPRTVLVGGEPLLYHAANKGCWATAFRLLEGDAVTGENIDGGLRKAMAEAGDNVALKLLVRYLDDHGAPQVGADGKEKPAEITTIVDEAGNTLLHDAGKAGCPECCRVLLEARFDCQLRNHAGQAADEVAEAEHGAAAEATVVLNKARRAADLGLSTGIVKKTHQWAMTYKAKVKKAETEAMRKSLEANEGVVAEKQVWVQSYKAEVKHAELEEMQRAIGGNRGSVAARREWAETFKSEKAESAATADARATIGASNASLRSKWQGQLGEETKEAPAVAEGVATASESTSLQFESPMPAPQFDRDSLTSF